jgi:predicted Zn finger-like uncharacterized protein
MHVECNACGARYVIADEKIPIQGARVRCRKCQAVFSIERSAAVPPAPPAPAELPLIPPTPQAAAPSPFEAPAAPSPLATPAPPPEPSPLGAHAASSRFDTSPFESSSSAAVPSPAAPSRFDASPFESQAPAASPFTPPAPPAGHGAPAEIEKFANAFASSAPMPAPPAATSAPGQAAAPPPPPPAPSSPPPPPMGAGPAQPAAVSPFSPSAGIPPGLPEAERLKHERARRLARVLASDIAIYNKEKRDRGIKDGNLVAVLGYEIKKSWEVYKERVTPEMANSTPYFRDALNEMLAEGKKVF